MIIDINKSFSQIQNAKGVQDEVKVENLTRLFFIAIEEDYKSDLGSAWSVMLSREKSASKNFEKILYNFGMRKALKQNSSGVIIADNLMVHINYLEVIEDRAIVTVYENYEYELDTACGEKSLRGITYTLYFVKVNNEWLIADIKTNDETFVDFGENGSYDLGNAIEKMRNPVIPRLSAELAQREKDYRDGKLESLSALSPHTYDQTRARTWAYNYSNSSGSNNDSSCYSTYFANYNPNDCQNFASQCVWYGLGGVLSTSSIENKNIPMVASGSRAWHQSKTQYDSAATWTSCTNFGNYVSNSSYSVEGIYGWVNSNVLYAEIGDTIQISNGTAWYHTYVVYNVTGTSGSRTTSNIWVCAHSANRRNEQLSTITSQTMRNIRIIRGYY